MLHPAFTASADQPNGEFGLVAHVAFSKLEDIRLSDIPPFSMIEIDQLPVSKDGWYFSISVMNHAKEHGNYAVKVHCLMDTVVTGDGDLIIARLRRLFLPMLLGNLSVLANPAITREARPDGTRVAVEFSSDSLPVESLVADAIEPYLGYYRRFVALERHVFVCYASEDKLKANALAAFLRGAGADVWIDQWELKVGDSIVAAIDRALATVTHVAVLISTHSISKPWVKKEWSAALIRQLRDRSLSLLPIRLDDSELPTILGDIRYADCRVSTEDGFREVLDALFRSPAYSRDA